MKYELECIENLINTNLNPAGSCVINSIEENLHNTVTVFREEKERLRKVFMDASYQCKKKYSFALYIHHHQQYLILASNTIYNYQHTTHTKILQTAYTQCMGCIEELLSLLRYDFKDYTDNEITVTHYYRASTETEVKKYSIAQQKLWKQISIPEKLQQIVLNAFDEYIQDENYCSYHRYHYLQKLNASLLQIKDETSLIECLYIMNFNSVDFINWYTNHLTDSSISNHKNETNLRLLNVQLEENDGHIQLQNTALYPTAPCLKTAIRSRLEEAVGSIRQQENVVAAATKNNSAAKIKLNLSVKQLAYLLQLFEDVNIIEAGVKKDVFECVINSCSSKEQTDIAIKSLQNNCRDVILPTKIAVKDMLIKMLNIVNRK